MAKKFTKEEVSWILDCLEETFPNAKPELVVSSPFEMLITIVLSAQCTDVRINMVTEEVYKKYKTSQDPIGLGIQSLKPLIRSYGLYKNRVKDIVMTARISVEDYRSQVPETIEGLIKLPGVGQRTTNVVASTCFGVDTIAVDTYVFRTSSRAGLVKAKTVGETEVQLQKATPRDQ